MRAPVAGRELGEPRLVRQAAPTNPKQSLPWPHLRMFMGATLSQAPALGLKRSTELRQLVPSLPPATYRAPSRTATPAELRLLNMEATGVHAFTWQA